MLLIAIPTAIVTALSALLLINGKIKLKEMRVRR